MKPHPVDLTFKDVPADEETREEVRASVERRWEGLHASFPETARLEVHFAAEGDQITGHAHVTGKQTEAATHATAPELALVADLVLERLARQLRRAHDKRIFSRRREAQKQRAKA